MKYKQGFTVVELVIVIAILGIMTSVALVKFSTTKNKKTIENGAEDIVTTLNKASSKTLASLNSTTYGVHFEPGAIVIFTGTVYPGSLGASGNEQYTSIVSPTSITNVTLNGVSGTTGELYFNRLTGLPSKTGTITISTSEFSKVITIGATGILSRGPIIDASAPTYSLTVVQTGSLNGNIVSDSGNINCGSTCSGNFTSGSTVILTSTMVAPNTTAYSGDCSNTGGNSVTIFTCTVVMNGNKNITANSSHGNYAAP